ncbi:hypothetical protein KP77_12610 [Jeotgalibacillus alimentarius]|uniref:DUF3231 family protein n=1 Tax=Jeotgalibacillus alimentarius TaxID=135826 RepID=A0A0C2SCQ4_9BACL|nr:DUF3231 family protein [Jeotgalibacillus alimentarius]KIL51749.1 hypothetical protein KP77_12610 [Jeotgalibacillus alimentarius]
MGILSGAPKNEPLHYGEIYGVWSALLKAKSSIAANQTLLNHAGDRELRELIEEAIKMGQDESRQLEELLIEHQIQVPPSPPARAKAGIDQIPDGARFQDPEIAASIAASTGTAMTADSQMIAQCVREDVGLMFAQFHTQKVAFAAKTLRLSKEKGWLIPPPLYQIKEMAHQG